MRKLETKMEINKSETVKVLMKNIFTDKEEEFKVYKETFEQNNKNPFVIFVVDDSYSQIEDFIVSKGNMYKFKDEKYMNHLKTIRSGLAVAVVEGEMVDEGKFEIRKNYHGLDRQVVPICQDKNEEETQRLYEELRARRDKKDEEIECYKIIRELQ